MTAPPAVAAGPPLIAADTTRPNAALEIRGGTTYNSIGPDGRQDVACIVFVNHGPRMATKVGLSLAMLDASGTVLGVEVMYPTGKFPVDARSAFSGGRISTQIPNGNCHGIFAQGSAAHSNFVYRPRKGDPATEVAAILVSVREIVYDDGTAFRTDQVPQTGDKLPLPTAPPYSVAVADGPPPVTVGTVAGSPIELTDAFRVENVVQTGGGPGGGGLLGLIASIPVTTRASLFCMTFANRDPRDVKNVRVNLAVLDRAGNVGAVETMDSKGPFATAAASADSGSSCEGFRGKWDADTFMYQPKDGTPFAVGRVVITPGIVEFTDGTTWTVPNPPVPNPPAPSTSAPNPPAASTPAPSTPVAH
ncbi:MAG: hypothetical protein JO036_07210 [Candidatus Eremiobacteraeota bacterium]|nr:hypothetical protein [Candidatus Eremiobacteraeota bacterium]